jgi:plasmid replication initiation protein
MLNQQDIIHDIRRQNIFKADEMIQNSRFNLTLTEFKIILFAISKVKPNDDIFQEYKIKLSDFYTTCGIKKKESYNEIKKIIENLSNKSWWILRQDPNYPNEICESCVRWFEVVRINRNSNIVTIAFHRDMMPYIIKLHENFKKNNKFYTFFPFLYILKMKSIYSPRLYELLKSYQKNNYQWSFEIKKLRYLLNCDEKLKRFSDFKKRAIDPAVKDINDFSDLKINYITKKYGNTVTSIIFTFEEKSIEEKISIEKQIFSKLDGPVYYWDIL